MAVAPSCLCGECAKCKGRAYTAASRARKTPEERRRANYGDDPDAARAKRREWIRLDRERDPEKYLKRQRENRKRQRELHPERERARRMVYDAIRRGKLARQPCEVCGEPKTQAHHEDYARPLDVQWLCRRHHWAEHTSV